MGEVQGLVVLSAAVRVREHRFRLLKTAEFNLAAARSVRVALLGELAVSFSDLRLGGVTRDAEYLIVVDLLCHRTFILTHRKVPESAVSTIARPSQGVLDLLSAPPV